MNAVMNEYGYFLVKIYEINQRCDGIRRIYFANDSTYSVGQNVSRFIVAVTLYIHLHTSYR